MVFTAAADVRPADVAAAVAIHFKSPATGGTDRHITVNPTAKVTLHAQSCQHAYPSRALPHKCAGCCLVGGRMSSMGLVRKMSAEMGLLAFTALIGCFEASTSVRAPPTRLAIMRAPGPAPLSPHAL